MPSCPRNQIVQEGTVGVYHCYNRCVRRAWLCGRDPVSGKDFEHRRQWIVDRERLLASLFGIEIGFHCEMANHLHAILRTRPDVVETWSDEEAVRRWLHISHLTCHFADTPVGVSDAEVQLKLADPEEVFKLRKRLSSVSWFMACLTEHISKRANREDGCRGRFWEGRFHCRNLADESAILVCGIYVDLNPIHAGEVTSLDEARYTSAYHRMQGQQQRARSVDAGTTSGQAGPADSAMPADAWLCELTLAEGPESDIREGLGSKGPWRASDKGLLPVSLTDYLGLCGWTAQALREDNPETIPQCLATVLERLGIRPAHFLESVRHFDKWFGRAVGRVGQLLEIAARTGRRRLKGQPACVQLFV